MKLENLVKIEGLLILTIISTALFFVGKAMTSPTGMVTVDEEVSKIQAGMGSSEIKDMLGEPYEVDNINEGGVMVEYWYYAQGDYTLRIGFKYGIVDSKVVR